MTDEHIEIMDALEALSGAGRRSMANGWSVSR